MSEDGIRQEFGGYYTPPEIDDARKAELDRDKNLTFKEAAWKQFDKAEAVRRETEQSFPKKIDEDKLNEFSEADQPLIDHTFKELVKFLKSPIITDRFADHADRAVWRKEAELELRYLDQIDPVVQEEKKKPKVHQTNYDLEDQEPPTDRVGTFTEIYKSNRLNLNTIGGLPGYVAIILDDQTSLPKDFPIEALRKIAGLSEYFKGRVSPDGKSHSNPWTDLPLENHKDKKGHVVFGKLTIANEMERAALKLVNYLGKK